MLTGPRIAQGSAGASVGEPGHRVDDHFVTSRASIRIHRTRHQVARRERSSARQGQGLVGGVPPSCPVCSARVSAARHGASRLRRDLRHDAGGPATKHADPGAKVGLGRRAVDGIRDLKSFEVRLGRSGQVGEAQARQRERANQVGRVAVVATAGDVDPEAARRQGRSHGRGEARPTGRVGEAVQAAAVEDDVPGAAALNEEVGASEVALEARRTAPGQRLLDRPRDDIDAEDTVAETGEPEGVRAEAAADVEDPRSGRDETSEQLVQALPWLRVLPRRVAGEETSLEVVGQLPQPLMAVTRVRISYGLPPPSAPGRLQPLALLL